MEHEAPWLCKPQRNLAGWLLRSHQHAFGRPLLGLRADDNSRHLAQELFASETVVLAHDGSDPGGDPGPRLIYANRAALRLWRRPWGELIGMPSRLTAEPAEQADRTRVLRQAYSQHISSGYSGIRIDSHGRRFQICGARIWTLWDQESAFCGQAAAFSNWHWL